MSKDGDLSSVSALEGRYVSNFRIGWNAQEFLLDFGQLGQGTEDDEGRFFIRLVAVPTNAKRLLALLEESVRGYEGAFGTIRSADDKP